MLYAVGGAGCPKIGLHWL